MTTTVLCTGGAGYIGTHVVAELLGAGHAVTVLDDLSNSEAESLDRVAALGHGAAHFVHGDVRDPAAVDAAFAHRPVDVVIHLAGLKAVGESVAEPVRYWSVNVGGTLVLLDAMVRHRVRRLVFSSSATVYGEPETNPIPETAPLGPKNPYGQTKLAVERVLSDFVPSRPEVGAVSLRYFNPVGAHASGLIGENPRGIPNNLFPFIARTAAGLLDKVRVFGNDYPTPDGTGVRDYIHVVDLARGHLAALEFLLAGEGQGAHLQINLGRGHGYSVLEALAAFSRAVGQPIPHEIVGRRPGDAAETVADPARAAALLGWQARLDLDAMCADHWAFQRRLLLPADG